MKVQVRGYTGTIRNSFVSKDGLLFIEIWHWGEANRNYFGWIVFPAGQWHEQ